MLFCGSGRFVVLFFGTFLNILWCFFVVNHFPPDCVIHSLIRVVVAHMHHLIARVVVACVISMFHVLCVVVCVLLLC